MLSIVIPVLNEAQNIETLFDGIQQTLETSYLEREIIFVDDGSTDNSWECIKSLAEKHPSVHALRFRCNHGKSVALNEGFKHAHGDVIITMDADLQDDPREIPKLMKKLSEGFDLVSGWRKIRHDPWHKVFPSRLFNWLITVTSRVKIHDHNCGLKCYRRTVIKEIGLHGGLHRFTTLLADQKGFKVAEIEVRHLPRIHGVSKYGWRRFSHGLLDLCALRLLSHYRETPFHCIGFYGLIIVVLGFFALGCLPIFWCLGYKPVGVFPLLLFCSALLFLGVQMIWFELFLRCCFSKDQDSPPIKEHLGVGW